jgi:hypothetical protein
MKTFIATLLVALAIPAAAAAAPPANDNRADAAQVPSFPSTTHGTTVEATVERLDPQVSECGQVEDTVWYRIHQAPDGLIVLSAQGNGFAPVIRAYRQLRSSIQEVDCASAAAGGAASVSFESVRGASFLVLVGRRPGTADAEFDLKAELFLPPKNDRRRGAAPLARAGVQGSTLGATTDEGDPKGCGLAGGTVWYSLPTRGASRLVVRLQVAGELDATLAVVARVRSESHPAGCAPTNRKGAAEVTFDTERGATYLVVVGQRKGSPPGTFKLSALAAQAPEHAPGTRLPAGGAHSTVHGLTDVNDIFWTVMQPGTTYRLAFRSDGCASLYLRRARQTLRELECGGYLTFTPGPDGGGRYLLEVEAGSTPALQRYRLELRAAEPDDLGIGLALGTIARGSLAPQGVDVVDVYHFDIARTSDVQLHLGQSATSFSLLLLSDTGGRIAGGSTDIRRRLGPGRYVVATRADVGTPGGRYALSLLVRDITSTSLTARAGGHTLTFTAGASPASGGAIEIEVDRFDPLGGWQFVRMLRVSAPGGSVSWTAPAAGRWRARASFLGSHTASPSRSGYAFATIT